MTQITKDVIASNVMSAAGDILPSVCRRRWCMLAIFFIFTGLTSFQWGQFVIISNSVVQYYDVTPSAVDWTTRVFMIAYLPLVIPSLWLLKIIGIKATMVVCSAGICAGAWIKFYSSLDRSYFLFAMVGQTIVAVFQILVFGLAPKVTAIWFGPKEVSFASSLAVFGDQLGNSIGFILPVVMVRRSENIDNIGEGLARLNVSVAIVATLVLLCILFCFEGSPPVPPSAAQIVQKCGGNNEDVSSCVWTMIKNVNCMLMMASYGVNVGLFNAFITVFNSIFLHTFSGHDDHIGYIYFGIMVFGISGSVVSGYFLDKTHLYKESVLVIYGCSFLSMLMFAFSLHYAHLPLVYITCILFGASCTIYYSVGIQFVVEITYPVSETISASFLLMSTHMWGIIFTFLYRELFESWDALTANLVAAGILLIGNFITCVISPTLNRHETEKDSQVNGINRNG